ncbi:MAG: S-methyl-5-thioribose-1-phosphate isomerase [Candidatus Helarchaeota archaeon]|nr:S-methyl-5-thioribose-1-phosphate isomerase [Candidatus Helarchaeota archaeon]
MDELLDVAEKIKRIEIQGASNVAKAGIKAFADYLNSISFSNKNELTPHMLKAKDLLFKARDTEPALWNCLKLIIKKVNKSDLKAEADLKALVSKSADYYISQISKAKIEIGRIGARRIANGMIIMTHCHSSAAEQILIQAHKDNKDLQVICTETRPKLQGHITAKVLTDAGIDVTMVVDSAMRWVLRNKDVDMIITGADAITSEGTVLNKIGSRLLALAAAESHVSYYVATPLLKYDTETVVGHLTKIELRDPEEIWLKDKGRPWNLKLENPAFETVSREYIAGLITEVGIFASEQISLMFEKYYEI